VPRVRGRRMIAGVILLLLLAGVACAEKEKESGLLVRRLRWDGREEPLGIVQFEPRLSWAASSTERGQKQTAYQVLVASQPEKLLVELVDIWDSGKVVTTDFINIHYGGPTPKAREQAFWTVRIWDRDDKPSPWAPSARWEMGLYDEEWEGQWIGRRRRADERPSAQDRSVVYLRKPFSLSKTVTRARLYSSAFGLYEISLNGERVGDEVLAPGFTDYEKRVLFQTHDVTEWLRQGDNVIGAVVGGGWCTAGLGGRSGACGLEPPRVMVQLEVTLDDGSTQILVTDESWTSHDGPIASAHLYDGEKYDARRDMPGWNRPGYDARDWLPAQQYDKEKERDLVADSGPPTKVNEKLPAVNLSEPTAGVYVFDFGQNIVGWASLTTSVPAGTRITLRFAEALRADGMLYVENLRRAQATDEYMARGQENETWEPHFSVHGFRYVEVRGLSSRPSLSAVKANVVHSVMPEVGSLETSNSLLNQLFANIRRSQRGAFLSVPTTGPQRDERLGSMLDAQVFAGTACLNYDVQLLFRKWIDDIRDAQHPNAAYSDTAPLVHSREGGAGAGSAGILVPWAHHRCYADRAALDAHLPSMGRWLDLIRTENPDLLWTKGLEEGPSDPLEIGPATDRSLIATAQLAYLAEALAEMMRSAGATVAPSARPYDELARGARAAFGRTFVRADGRLASDTQTAYALAISTGALSGEARDRAGTHLAAAIERAGRHLTTGVLGTAHLLPALSLVDRDDLAYVLLLQESCPSWLCSIKNGATTLWEHWDGFVEGRGFADASSNSLNHYAFGAVGEWMYDAIGGIALDGRAPAGRHFLVRPRPGGGLTYAKARYESMYGPIRTEWSREDAGFRLKVNLPPGSTATVTLPFGGRATESRVPVRRAPGVKVLEEGPMKTVVSVESGAYDFAIATKP